MSTTTRPDSNDRGTTVTRRFANQVDRCGNSVAVRAVSPSGTARLSYSDLDARANAAAIGLRELGVRAESPVAVLMERGIELAVTLLAVVKAGGVYLPLHPSFPAQRVSAILDDTAAQVVVTDATHRSHAGLPDTAVDAADLLRPPEPGDAMAIDEAVDDRIDPHQLVYIMYTSGSTGTPKGVAVTHANIVDFADETCWAQPGHERVLMHSSHAFDASTYEFWVPLLTGNEVVMAPSGQLQPDTVAALFADEQITSTFVTTGLFNLLADESPAAFRTLRQVWTGGDTANPQALARVREHCPDTTIVNGYGPTEATTFATTHEITVADTERRSIPIGHALDSTDARVLGGQLEAVADGEIGELYLGGGGLARGYVNRPGVTAERFVPDVVSADGSRMYRTGDLVRRGPDGRLEFCGRADGQVKLRGFRIELGEIDLAYTALDEVAQAVAIVREDVPGDKRLVVYVVGRPGAEVDPDAMRTQTAEVLPDYMLPAATVVLDALPLNSNGKVDRGELPEPVASLNVDGRLPRTPHEEILCGLFGEILDVDGVGVEDDFFDLGGHSLLATRLLSRLRSVFGTKLSLRDVFQTPTVLQLAAKLVGRGTQDVPARRGGRPAVLPLSNEQRPLWFINRLHGPSATYNIRLAYHLDGELDVPALRRAVADVVARHEVLRTVYPEVEGEPRQVIIDALDLPPVMSVEDVREGSLADAVAAEAWRGFDVTWEAPIRARLFSSSPREHALLIVLHHIAGDGSSVAPFMRDLASAYAARADGRQAEWDELPMQYADYALWQRELLGDPNDPESEVGRGLAYWTQRLDGMPEQIALPLDHSRPPVASERGGAVEFTLDPALHRSLVGLARQTRSSLFMVLQAALALTLSRYGGGNDIPIGTTTGGRVDESLNELVGVFMNSIVLRTDLSGRPTFTELVERVRESDLDDYAHQSVPFERLVDALNPTRTSGMNPLFQVLLELHQKTLSNPHLPGVSVRECGIEQAAAKLDLAVICSESRDANGRLAGITGILEYAADLFEDSTIAALAGRFVEILRTIADSPQRPIADIEILTDAERHQIIDEWNDTRVESAPASLPQLFEDQAARTPDAPAVRRAGSGAQSGVVTYRDLDSAANRLAQHLTHLGVEPESMVGVCLEHSVDLLVALLAVMKTGAAYVPLDARHPAERLGFVVEDTSASVVVTHSELIGVLDDAEVTPVCIDRDADAIAACSATPVDVDTDPDMLAYVIYTSGSTGRPKGVMVSHRGLVNYLEWAVDAYGIEDGCGAPLVGSIAFDLSIPNFFLPLISGKAVTLLGGEDEIEALADALRGDDVFSLLKITPGHLEVLRATLDEDSLVNSVGTYVVGADEVRPDTVQAWRQVAPDATIINEYGPTETVVGCSAYEIDGDRDPARPIPIGKPIANTRMYVLDEQLRPVPVGVTGELYIAGSGVARGYLKRPRLSAERFVADPFGPAGERMYRAGDLARYAADGNLEFLGRTDNQIKLRGYRIEPGEIESRLLTHPSIRSAVVSAASGQLAAYYVPAADAAPASLAGYLAEFLPAYMVPTSFTPLDRLPLTAAGKVDLDALPAPHGTSVESPQTPAEQKLCRLVGALLNTTVGPDANFFSMGGDSIMSIQLVSAARKAGLRITPSDVYRASSLAELAAIARCDDDTPRSAPETGVGQVPPTPVMRWLDDRVDDRPETADGYNQSVLVQVPAAVDAQELTAAIGATLDKHDLLRARLLRDDSGRTAALEVGERGLHDVSSLLETIDVSGDDPDDIPAAIEAGARRIRALLDPVRGHMVRAIWFDRGRAQPGMLLLMCHHLVIDGVSWRILVADLSAAWQQIHRGEEPDSIPDGTPYRIWSELLATEARAATRLGELDHWRAILATPAPLAPDAELVPRVDTVATAASITVRLTPEETRPLLTTVPEIYRCGVDEVLVTALAAAVGGVRGNGGSALTVDLENHGRSELGGADVSQTVGWFTNTYPVRVDAEPAGDQSTATGAALKRVKEQLRSVPGDGLGFGLLRYLNPDTAAVLADLPRPQVCFNYLGRYTAAGTGEWDAVWDADIPAAGMPDEMTLPYLLEVTAQAVDSGDESTMRIDFTWASRLLATPDVQDLADRVRVALRDLAAEAEGGAAVGVTPSDVSLVSVSQDEIDDLEALLRR